MAINKDVLKKKLAELRGPRIKPKLTGKLPAKAATPLTQKLAELRKTRIPGKEVKKQVNIKGLEQRFDYLISRVDAFSKYFNQNIDIMSKSGRSMPDFRKLGIGLQSQISDITGGGGGNPADAEVPTGTVNGTNKVFTLANTPNPSTTLKVFVNGQRMKAGGEDYTFSGNTVTFITAPPSTSILLVDYKY